MKDIEAAGEKSREERKKFRATELLKKQFFAPAAVARSRMAICEKCEFLNSVKLCRKCNCIMPAKTNLAGARCPEGKWGAYYSPKKPK